MKVRGFNDIPKVTWPKVAAPGLNLSLNESPEPLCSTSQGHVGPYIESREPSL